VTDDLSETERTEDDRAAHPRAAHTHATGVGRRTMLTSVAVAGVGVPLLAACGSDSATDSASSSSSAAGDTSSPAAGDSRSAAGAGDALAATSDVAVGGAVFLDQPSVVITQPSADDFHAFDRTCTHQGCPVTDLVDGNIHCSCHGSMFSATDGSVVQGPATQPLATVDITVSGGEILPA
jgi:Rieske Fe-S protein